jgi:hypothetical protein
LIFSNDDETLPKDIFFRKKKPPKYYLKVVIMEFNSKACDFAQEKNNQWDVFSIFGCMKPIISLIKDSKNFGKSEIHADCWEIPFEIITGNIFFSKAKKT